MAFRPHRAISGLPRASWLIAAASLVNRAGTMVMPFLALYLTRRIGLSDSAAGGMFFVFGVGSLLGSPVSGRLCDRVGADRVLVACLVASGLVLLAFPLARSSAQIAAMVFAFAITSEGVRPATLALAGSIVPPERRKDAFVLNRLAVNLGMSIGPAVGGVLVAVDFSWLFLIDGSTSVVAGLIVAAFPASAFRAVAPPSNEPDAPPSAARASSASEPAAPRAGGALRDRSFVRFLVGVVFVGLMFFQIEAALPLYLVGTVGLSTKLFGLICTVNTVLILALEVPLNSATNRWSHGRALALGAALVGVGFGSFVLAEGFLSAAASVVAITFGEMILFPGLSSFVADAAPPGRSGEYMGAFSMAFALAYALGPGLGVAALGRFGGAMWLGVFGLGLVTAALFARTAAGRPAPSPAAVT